LYGVKKLMLKLIDWRHKFRFYLLSLYVVPVSLFGVLFILHMIGLVEFKLDFYPLLMINLLANVVIGILPLTFVVGPFGEELGWRGYLLPRLLEKFHPIKFSLLIGIIWACWHLPLFLFYDLHVDHFYLASSKGQR
jgi:membrane protease YdiL (CAAX protease family)